MTVCACVTFAVRNRNQALRVTNLFIDHKMKEYLVTFIKKGTGALLRNVFDHEEVFVHDQMMSESTQPGFAIFVRIYPAGKFYLLSGGHISYPPMYLDEKLKEILKAYRKSGRTDGVNSFLRYNGYIFGRPI